MNKRRSQALVNWVLISTAIMLCAPAIALGQVQEDKDKFEGPLKEQLEEYWSVERDLPVIKHRLFTRAETIELGLYSGLMSSDPFYWYLPIGLRAGYYLSESFAVEFAGQYTLGFDTELTTFFKDAKKEGFDATLHTGDKFIFRTNVVAKWHPLYGKFAAFQRKLAHFDFNVVGGLGLVGYDRPNPTRSASETSVGLDVVLGGGLSFFVSKNLTIRLDGRAYVYLGPEFSTDEFTINESGENVGHGFLDRLTVPSEFMLGVSYSL